MKNLLLILLISLITQVGLGQEPDVINLEKFSINGVTGESTVEELIKEFGEADSIFDPNYDCGPLSPEWNNVEVLKYRFGKNTFHVVNGKIEIDEIYPNEETHIEYNGTEFSGKEVEDELKTLFPNSYANWVSNKTRQFVLWPCDNCDSEIWVWIENGSISKIKFHSPC